MLLGNIKAPGTYQPFLSHSVWRTALDWIQSNQHQPEGEYEINGRDVYASISTISTLSRSEGMFEAHKQYIDLHYCLEGGEIIEWAPVGTLGEPKETNEEKDYALHVAPAQTTRILMAPGTFAIFFPEDAHMPKISDGENTSTKKVVAKVKLEKIHT